jgi:hypothetical protein
VCPCEGDRSAAVVTIVVLSLLGSIIVHMDIIDEDDDISGIKPAVPRKRSGKRGWARTA